MELQSWEVTRPMATETVLIVDDEREIADLLEVYLRNENYTVRKFYHPPDALAYMEKELVSLAILDVMMPEKDGFTLCQKIRQKHLFPIIMLTAKTGDMDKMKCFHLRLLNSIFFGIYAKIMGAWYLRRSFLKRSGVKSFLRAATTPSWLILPESEKR